MSKPKQKLKTTKRLMLLFYVVLILMTLFTVASYTWFSLSRTPEVSDMALYVNSPTGMEISADPFAEEWQLQLSFADTLDADGILKPITWSEEDQMFYAASYGIDGRISDIGEPLNDQRHANKDNADGYYIVGTFYARTDQEVTVSLSPAVEVKEGLQGSGTFVIGTPLWNAEEIIHNNGGSGAEYAIRIGFKIQKTTSNGITNKGPATFIIYEPNSDRHIDDTRGYADTPSIDGGASLVPTDRLIRQTTSTWTEAYPVQREAVIHTLGEFETNTDLFTLEPDELARISVYVWLEGQDVDCTNVIGHEAQILASIQFATNSSGQSGLVPIEPTAPAEPSETTDPVE